MISDDNRVQKRKSPSNTGFRKYMYKPTEFDFFYGIDPKNFCYGYGVMVLGRISKHLSSKFPNKTRL